MTAGEGRAKPLSERGVLLTGATGFLGMEILARYLERSDRTVYALVRAGDRDAADARLRSTIRTLFGRGDAHRERVEAVPGDIEAPALGLGRRGSDALAEQVTDVVHCAATVSFSLPLEDSRKINVEGTRRVLTFADLCQRRGGLRRFSYISTAYVAGAHTGEFSEDQLEIGQSFRNSYERSKFEAERMVRQHRDRLPIQIFRPSIIVGERASGWTPSFNVLYAPLRAYALGKLPAVPARLSSPVDVVPVDYVADAVFELASREDDEDETYHLVAGGRATTVGRLIELSQDYLDRRPPLVLPPRLYERLIHPLLVRVSDGTTRRTLEQMRFFFPYFSMRVIYRDRLARSRLEPVGIRVPPIERYYGRLLDYAFRAEWGHAALGRTEAQLAAGTAVPASRHPQTP